MKNLASIEQYNFESSSRAKIDEAGNYLAGVRSGMLPPRRRVKILGAWVDDVLTEDAVALIDSWVISRRQNPLFPAQQVVTLNPEYLTLAQHDSELMDIINQSGLITPDGIGLVYASKVMRRSLRGRTTGVELTCAVASHSARLTERREGPLRLFLLGAAPGVAEKAAARLEEMYPGVCIAGCFAGRSGPEGDAESVAQVRAAQADVVLVAYGMGKQDRWIKRNLAASGAVVGLGIGGTFDYLAGEVPLPPTMVKKVGLEWAYRIATQKNRWKRAHFVPRFIMAVALAAPFYWLPAQEV